MKGRISLLVGGAAGYVLGTRAGRERYEQIKSQAQRAWRSDAVQDKATQAQDFAKEKAPVVKEAVKDKATEAASAAASAAKDTAQSVKDDDGKDGSSETAPYPTSATTGLR